MTSSRTGTRVDVINGRTLQHHVAQRGLCGVVVADEVFQAARVGEVQALVDAQSQQLGAHDHISARPGEHGHDCRWRAAFAVLNAMWYELMDDDAIRKEMLETPEGAPGQDFT